MLGSISIALGFFPLCSLQSSALALLPLGSFGGCSHLILAGDSRALGSETQAQIWHLWGRRCWGLDSTQCSAQWYSMASVFLTCEPHPCHTQLLVTPRRSLKSNSCSSLQGYLPPTDFLILFNGIFFLLFFNVCVSLTC